MSATDSLLKTPLFEKHQAAGARIVDFGGWALPVNYSSQVEEHHAVRNNVGMFDVSHMTVSDLTGADTLPFLSKLLANDINKVAGKPGKALYSCMLNEAGGVIDDLIVYYLAGDHCRMITNAATNEKDMAWLQKQAQAFADITVTEKPDLALIAVQGPKALETIKTAFTGEVADLVGGLTRFQGGFAGDVFVGRTGYTGEDGVEMVIPKEQAPAVWDKLMAAGVQPCGLGARDTLRLEAGMALYGSDLDEEHTPLESGLAWTVGLKDDREFIGKSVLVSEPAKYTMIGLVLEGKGVLRSHQEVVLAGEVIGETTSGSFSPTLSQSIAIARVKAVDGLAPETPVTVKIRNKDVDAKIVKYPFVTK